MEGKTWGSLCEFSKPSQTVNSGPSLSSSESTVKTIIMTATLGSKFILPKQQLFKETGYWIIKNYWKIPMKSEWFCMDKLHEACKNLVYFHW
jgi:hypothetical protein